MMTVQFICDRKKCRECYTEKGNFIDGCTHTQDVNHALNAGSIQKFRLSELCGKTTLWEVMEAQPEKPMESDKAFGLKEYHSYRYEILKHLFETMVNGEDPNLEELNKEKLNLNRRYWRFILEGLANEGLIYLAYREGCGDFEVYGGSITTQGIEKLERIGQLQHDCC